MVLMAITRSEPSAARRLNSKTHTHTNKKRQNGPLVRSIGTIIVPPGCGGTGVPRRGGSEIGPAVRADFRRLYPANAKTPTCCPSDDNRTKVTNSVTSARSLWWHVGPYFWPADLTRTANPILRAWEEGS